MYYTITVNGNQVAEKATDFNVLEALYGWVNYGSAPLHGIARTFGRVAATKVARLYFEHLEQREIDKEDLTFFQYVVEEVTFNVGRPRKDKHGRLDIVECAYIWYN